MRIAVWPADQGGCGNYRCIWPAQALLAQGADIDLRLPGDGSGIHGLFATEDGVQRLKALQQAPDADVVVIQRPLSAWRADIVELLQAHGIRVVVEIDDDFSTIHPANVSWRSCHPRTSPGRNWAHLARACRAADLVVATTPALARRYAGHGRSVVVPNHVPASYLEERRDLQTIGPVIGWTGSVDTHPTDLQVTRGGVQRAMDGTSAVMAVVGTGKGVQRHLGLSQAPLACGWRPLEEYPSAMAQFDIGIVPLDDIAFNQAKSWLKGLEMAAVGVPFIASPTDDYVRLHALGAGLLAAKPKDWHRQLRRLIDNEAEREDLAGVGRSVAAGLTIEGNADRWWDAWSSCLTKEKAIA